MPYSEDSLKHIVVFFLVIVRLFSASKELIKLFKRIIVIEIFPLYESWNEFKGLYWIHECNNIVSLYNWWG